MCMRRLFIYRKIWCIKSLTGRGKVYSLYRAVYMSYITIKLAATPQMPSAITIQEEL